MFNKELMNELMTIRSTCPMVWKVISPFCMKGMSKGDMVDATEKLTNKKLTIDYAVPLHWIKAVQEFDIATHGFVWNYSDELSLSGKPLNVYEQYLMAIIEYFNN